LPNSVNQSEFVDNTLQYVVVKFKVKFKVKVKVK